jgi:hypothetical protein
MLFDACATFLAVVLQATESLRAYANPVAQVQVLHFVPNSYNITYDFVTDAYGIVCRAPARSQSVYVGAADTTMGDFDIDIYVVEWFGFEGRPGHVALRSILIVA